MTAHCFGLAHTSQSGDADSQQNTQDGQGHHELYQRHTGLTMEGLHIYSRVCVCLIMQKIMVI